MFAMENASPAATAASQLVLLILIAGTGSGQGHLLSQPAMELRIQAQEQLISQHNDSAYVQRLMRLSKAAEMRNYMQTELEPCDNFYDYSCGNWPKINPANTASPRETNYEQLLVKGYHHKQQRLLQRPADAATDADELLKLKEFYSSCLHYRQTPLPVYREQLLEIAAEFGHMPVLALPGQEWPADDFDWVATVAHIKRKYGLDIILRLQVSPAGIYVGQPQQILPQPNRQARAATIADQLERHLGVETELARNTSLEITRMEDLVAQHMRDLPVGVLARPRTPEELDAPYSEAFNLTQYIELVLERPLNPNDTLYEHVPSYQAHLLGFLSNTTPREQANYIFHELLQHFYYEWSGSVVEHCMSKTRSLFPELLDNMVLGEYGDAATLSDIEAVWQQIKRSFRDLLENDTADWLALATRTQLLEQINATRLLINGHGDVNFTQTYERLELRPRDYLQNLRAVLSHDSLKTKLSAAPLTVASYDPVEKRVLLPVALLQPNYLWSRYYPRALRYGSLGTLLAHELAHSIEDVSHWDATSIKEYHKRWACFKEQYGRLRLNGEYLPKSDLQAENIADNLAVQVSYHAYSKYLAELAPSALSSERLPQMTQSPRQLFFISYAQFWCNDANERFRDRVSLLVSYTPNALRVLGALSNLGAFRRDFGCSSGSPMTSSQKCQLYGISLD
ncbi:neprilysin-11 [Drosophila pseudoobscura]|uniref:Neprilysin-11 n=1 Tax=Drosophila pseudoobscura pseudoobscura TaxID=46245 RepID=A0A6I8UPE1_DROPS|nr:neprilysin-11 [Drosophila pseudoobscura]